MSLFNEEHSYDTIIQALQFHVRCIADLYRRENYRRQQEGGCPLISPLIVSEWKDDIQSACNMYKIVTDERAPAQVQEIFRRGARQQGLTWLLAPEKSVAPAPMPAIPPQMSATLRSLPVVALPAIPKAHLPAPALAIAPPLYNPEMEHLRIASHIAGSVTKIRALMKQDPLCSHISEGRDGLVGARELMRLVDENPAYIPIFAGALHHFNLDKVLHPLVEIKLLEEPVRPAERAPLRVLPAAQCAEILRQRRNDLSAVVGTHIKEISNEMICLPAITRISIQQCAQRDTYAAAGKLLDFISSEEEWRQFVSALKQHGIIAAALFEAPLPTSRVELLKKPSPKACGFEPESNNELSLTFVRHSNLIVEVLTEKKCYEEVLSAMPTVSTEEIKDILREENYRNDGKGWRIYELVITKRNWEEFQFAIETFLRELAPLFGKLAAPGILPPKNMPASFLSLYRTMAPIPVIEAVRPEPPSLMDFSPLPSLPAPVSPANVGASPVAPASDGICVVCLDSPYNMACIPCGHVACCKGCSANIKACPMCRVAVTSFLPIYHA